jgi:type 1 glutamine amidotransferase
MNFDRRRFIQRTAKSGVRFCAAAAAAGPLPRIFAAPATDKPLLVCLVSGSEEYKSNESLASFQKQLERHNHVRCSRAFWTSTTNLPGLEALDSCDVMILFTRRLELPKEQLDRVKRYCLAGRPIVGLRTASHAFQNWLELDREIFGGSYSGHYGSGPTTKMKISPNASKHPILKGFKPYETTTTLYKNPRLAEDANPLLIGSIPEHTEPLAWTRELRGGRVFYTSLGGPEDFENDAFRQMLVNALYWTTKRKRSE